MKKISLLFAVLCFSLSSLAQAQEWKRLVTIAEQNKQQELIKADETAKKRREEINAGYKNELKKTFKKFVALQISEGDTQALMELQASKQYSILTINNPFEFMTKPDQCNNYQKIICFYESLGFNNWNKTWEKSGSEGDISWLYLTSPLAQLTEIKCTEVVKNLIADKKEQMKSQALLVAKTAAKSRNAEVLVNLFKTYPEIGDQINNAGNDGTLISNAFRSLGKHDFFFANYSRTEFKKILNIIQYLLLQPAIETGSQENAWFVSILQNFYSQSVVAQRKQRDPEIYQQLKVIADLLEETSTLEIDLSKHIP